MAASIEALRIERGIEKWHIVGEVMAPAINLLVWKLVMRLALEEDGTIREDRDEAVRDFYAPFHGLAGAWRLMSLLSWGIRRRYLVPCRSGLQNCWRRRSSSTASETRRFRRPLLHPPGT